MTKYSLWKIKHCKRTLLEEWCQSVMTNNLQESLETLVEEDLIQECCIFFGEGNNSYLLYKHQSIEGKEKKSANMSRELNRKHFEILHECLERVSGDAVMGYDLKVK